MPGDMIVSIGGREWQLVYDRHLKCDGTCDWPTRKHKTIRIRRGLLRDPKELMETLVHEVLHAANFDCFDEKYVDRLAEEMATVLWDQGFRLEA